MMAQYSIPFCVALAHVRDPHDPRSFNEDALRDPQIRSLAQRVTITVGEDRPTPLAAVVTVTLRDGRVLTRSVADFKGTPEQPARPERAAGEVPAADPPLHRQRHGRDVRSAAEPRERNRSRLDRRPAELGRDKQFGIAMTEHAGADNPHTRRIAEFVSTLTYERIPRAVRERIKLLILDSLGCAIYGARLEWCRILQATLRRAGRDAHDLGLGHAAAPLLPACGAGQRHAGAGLRARRRAPSRRAACGRRHAAGADRGGGEPRRPHRPGVSHRRRRRLRDRPARRPLHGAGAYRPGLAFRRDRRRLFGRRRRRAGLAPFAGRRPCTRSGSRARNRRG